MIRLENHRSLAPRLGLVVLLFHGSAVASGQYVSFFDGTFNDTDWSTMVYVSGNQATSGMAVQVAQGGNPGQARLVTHRLIEPGPSRVQMQHRLTTATYDPSSLGPIRSFYFAIDFLNIRTAGDGHRYRLGMWQGGRVYMGRNGATGLTRTTAGWQRHRSGPLFAIDMIEVFPDYTYNASSHPDLGPTGSPITLGLLTVNSDPSPWGSNDVCEVLYDNFRVEVNGAPAIATPRLGNPSNPDALRPGVTSGPIIGRIWDPWIDHTGFMPGASSDHLMVNFAPANVPTGFGTLLVDPSQLLAVLSATSPGTPFSIPIPGDGSLIGLAFYTQGGSLSALPSFSFTNALDIVIGSY